jgi:hypothetical protein
MTDVRLARPAVPGAVHPPAIALREIWPWALLGLVLLLQVYLVAADQGATAVASGTWLHEWVHDGRHLLGFPCH